MSYHIYNVHNSVTSQLRNVNPSCLVLAFPFVRTSKSSTKLCHFLLFEGIRTPLQDGGSKETSHRKTFGLEPQKPPPLSALSMVLRSTPGSCQMTFFIFHSLQTSTTSIQSGMLLGQVHIIFTCCK